MPLGAVPEALEKASTFRAVVLCEEGEVDLLAKLLAGSQKPHGVVAVNLDSSQNASRCPGVVGNQVAFRRVKFTYIATAGVDTPKPKVVGEKVMRYDNLRTAVLYVRLYKEYFPVEGWKHALQNPQRVFHAWVAKRHLNPDHLLTPFFRVARLLH